MSDLYIFRSSLKDLLRPKKLVTAALLIAVPALLAVLWRWRVPAADYQPEALYNTLAASLIFGFILVILAVVFGTGVITQEIEQKTIVYLLTRPVPRWRIILMKFLAALVAITITVWIASLLVGVIAFGFGGSSESSHLLATNDLKNSSALAKKLQDAKDPLSQYLAETMPNAMQALPSDTSDSSGAQGGGPRAIIQSFLGNTWEKTLVNDLNGVIQSGEPLYDKDRFAGVTLSEATRRLVDQKPTGKALARLNRRLLAEAYPNEIAPAPSASAIVGKDVLILPIGAMAYGALFLFLATILNRPLMYGLMFAFGWESWVPSLPGNFQKLSLMAYLRALAPHPKPETPQSGIASILTAFNPATITVSLAWTVLILFIAAALFAALLIFSTNEYVPREDAE